MESKLDIEEDELYEDGEREREEDGFGTPRGGQSLHSKFSTINKDDSHVS